MQLPKSMANDMKAKIEKDKKEKSDRGFFAKLMNRDKDKKKKEQEKKLAERTASDRSNAGNSGK